MGGQDNSRKGGFMNRLRFSSIVLCALAIATVAAATTPIYNPPADDVVGAATERTLGIHSPKRCDPCTLICPVGKKVLQNGHCECRCLTLPQECNPEEPCGGPH
jgi:hypothetical protein